jgi:hypothetical protein
VVVPPVTGSRRLHGVVVPLSQRPVPVLVNVTGKYGEPPADDMPCISTICLVFDDSSRPGENSSLMYCAW